MSSSFPQGAGNRSRQTPDNIRTLWQQSMPPPLPATTSRGMGVLDIADNVPPSRMPELPWPFDRSPSQTLLGTADPAFVYSDRSSSARSDTPSFRNEASSARSTNELRTILVPQAVVDPRFHMRDFALGFGDVFLYFTVTQGKHQGKTIVSFYDVRDASAFHACLADAHWPVQHVTDLELIRDFARDANAPPAAAVADTGEVVVRVWQQQERNEAEIGALLESYGPLIYCRLTGAQREATSRTSVASFSAKFVDIRDARKCMAESGSIYVRGMYMTIQPPDEMALRAPLYAPVACSDSKSRAAFPLRELMSASSHAARDNIAAAEAGMLESYAARASNARLAKQPTPRSSNKSDSSNDIDVAALSAGIETRTTVMIKNIPNRLTQSQLQNWLNVTSARQYDFVYLRMDFANKLNVGYAFVDFITPTDVIHFVETRAGHAWNYLYSDKVCTVSWANIQGKSALVEKFRNSSVMDEDESYRPRLFYSDGEQRGDPEPFPMPNDLARKIKSIVNAQQLGLFSSRKVKSAAIAAAADADATADANANATADASAAASLPSTADSDALMSLPEGARHVHKD